jgi:hypothetical protein
VNVSGLRHKIKCAQRQSFEGDGGTFGAVRTHYNYGYAMTPHDLFQHVNAVHTRHFQIKGHDLWLQFLKLFQPEVPVHCRPNHLNGRIRLQYLWD